MIDRYKYIAAQNFSLYSLSPQCLCLFLVYLFYQFLRKVVKKPTTIIVDLYLSSCCLAIALIYLESLLIDGHLFMKIYLLALLYLLQEIHLSYLFLWKPVLSSTDCFPRLLFRYSYLVYISPSFYFPPDWVFLSSSLLWNILMDSVFEFNQNSELSYIIFV